MQELLEWLEYIEETEDTRQQSKVLHPLKNILVIVLFATLANKENNPELFTQPTGLGCVNNSG